MHKILLIDDDPKFCQEFKQRLSNYFDVEVQTSASSWLEEVDEQRIIQFKAIVVDLYLEDCDGINLIIKAREKLIHTPPFLILTSGNNEKSRIFAYQCNVSDFLDKRHSDEELVARIGAAIERVQSISPCMDGLQFHLTSLTFSLHNTALELTKIETKMLYNILISSQSKLAKSDLIKIVWPRAGVSPQTLNSHLFNLNKKLKNWGHTLIVGQDSQIRVSSRPQDQTN